MNKSYIKYNNIDIISIENIHFMYKYHIFGKYTLSRQHEYIQWENEKVFSIRYNKEFSWWCECLNYWSCDQGLRAATWCWIT